MRAVAASSTIALVAMKASKPFAPMDHRTTQTTSPNVAATIKPIARRMLSQRLGELGGQDGHRRRRILRLRRRAHETAADDHTVGAGRRGVGRLRGSGDAEADG